MSRTYIIDYAPPFSPSCAATTCHLPITARTLRIGLTHCFDAQWRHWDCAAHFQLKQIHNDNGWETTAPGLLKRDTARVVGDLRRGYMLDRDVAEGDRRVREWELDDGADWEWKVQEVGRWDVGEGDEIVERWRGVMEKLAKPRSPGKRGRKSLNSGTPRKTRSGRRTSPRLAAAGRRTSSRVAAANRRMLC